MDRLMTAALAVALLGVVTTGHAKDPDCTHIDAWPSGMAYSHLKNAGIIDPAIIDYTKTVVTRVASERIGRDLYRQVHRVVFTRLDGGTVTALTVGNASNVECSMSGVDVYLVSAQFGDYSTAK